jgi:hypothetical protein
MKEAVGEYLRRTEYKGEFDFSYSTHDFRHSMTLQDVRKYPHIFREVPWWEDRKPEDLPEYVLSKTTGDVFRLTPNDCINGYFINEKTGWEKWYMTHFVPATPSDYEAQSNQKK